MEGDILLFYLIVGIILIIIVLGILIWAIVSIVSGKDKKAPKERTAQAVSTASERGGADQKTSSVSARKATSNDAELLIIFRNVNTGAIYVEIDGRQYHHLTDVYDPHTSRLLLQTVADLNRFTRGVMPAVPTKPTADTPSQPPRSATLPASQESQPSPGSLAKRGEALMKDPQSAKVEPGTIPATGGGLLERALKLSNTPSVPVKTPAQEPKPVPEKQTTSPSAFEKTKQKTELGSFWGRALTPSSPGASKVGPRPLADEFEDLLQDIIEEMPSKPAHDLHFRTAADGRLIIEVDGASYQDVSEIQNTVARQIIQAVIKKWESK